MPTLLTPLSLPRVQSTQDQPFISAEALTGRRHGAEEEMPGDPCLEVEQPWHMHAARYIAIGMSFTDTARACDCSVPAISRLARTPWFSERVKQLMSEGKTDIMSLFKASAFDAVTTLIEINANPKAPASARLNAAQQLLDRHLGKSVQHLDVKAENTHISDPVAREAQLQKEVEQIRSSFTSNSKN